MATTAAAATTTSNAFIALARLAVDEFALEDLAESRIEEAVEAPDRVELAHVDIFAGHAGRIDVHVDHLADHQRMPVGAELEHALKLALEMDRHLLDPRRLDLQARDRGEPGFGEFGIAFRESVGRIHHLLPHRLRHHVEAELAGLADVSQLCFSLPSGLRAMVSEIIGGMTQTTVKKENGARLVTPASLTVDAQPIGRGTTEPTSMR